MSDQLTKVMHEMEILKRQDNTHGEENNNNNTIPIRLIPYIKGRYCDSEFDTEEEKNEHELELHV